MLPEVRDGMRDWKLGRVVTVVDRGFSSNANLDYLRQGGGHWIAGERMRDHAGDAAQALSRQGRFTVVNDHLHVKEANLDSTPGVRWIICLNTAEAVKDKTTRDEAVTRLEAELARVSDARAKASAALKSTSSVKARSRLEAELAGHTRTECALRDHVTLGRWLRQTSSGRLVIDRARIAAETKLDGKYLLSTSDPHLTPAQVALGYKNLLEAERGFRDMKSTLMLRPVFHRLEPRIRAHVLICWLALLLVRVAETNTTWDRISHEMDRLAAVTLTGPAGTVVQATEPTDLQRALRVGGSGISGWRAGEVEDCGGEGGKFRGGGLGEPCAGFDAWLEGDPAHDQRRDGPDGDLGAQRWPRGGRFGLSGGTSGVNVGAKGVQEQLHDGRRGGVASRPVGREQRVGENTEAVPSGKQGFDDPVEASQGGFRAGLGEREDLVYGSVEDCPFEVLLAADVPVDHGVRDTGPGGDLADGDVGDRSGGHELGGDVQDGVPSRVRV